MTPYYADGEVTIYHGDAREVLASLTETVACSVFSPPYNVGIDYDSTSDLLSWGGYRELAAGVCRGIAAVQPHGRTWVNVTPTVPVEPIEAGDHSGRGSNRRISLLSLWDGVLLENAHLPWDYVAWTTPGRGPGCAWGSWESPAGPNMRGEWEVVIAAHTGSTWWRGTPDGHRGWKDAEGAWIELTSNVWKMRPESRGPGTGDHPAPFPRALPMRCIRLSTWPGELVLDPFMGSGQTLLAARSLGRRSVGVDASERYCEQVATRLSQGLLFGEVSA